MFHHQWRLGAFLLGLVLSATAFADDKPNIILILADDMGWSDLGCYGSEIATPNLDQLAADGLRFTQFHNTSKCFPSRACLLTGVYAQQCGMARGAGKIQRAVTLGEVLRGAGYRTYWTGKHHGTENPHDRGFDRYFGLRDGCCNYFNPGVQREGEPDPARKRTRTWCIDGETFKPYTPKEKDFYTTDYFTNYALQYLDEDKADKRPFFLYLAYTAPHDPLMAWPEDIAKYKGKYMAGYKKIRDARFKKQQDIGLIDDSFKLSPISSPDWDKLSEEKKQEEDLKMAIYAAMIDRMDQNIGRVIKKVEDLGQTDNTLILFAADNGGSSEMVRLKYKGEPGTMATWLSVGGAWANVSNTPLRKFKNFSRQGGISTPLVARWPAVIKKKGGVTHHVGHMIDFMATFVDITDATYPDTFNGQAITPLQGASFLPVLKGADQIDRNPLYWQWGKGKAVRNGKWKLVSQGGDWELYDMDKDRSEINDLATSNPEVTEELKKMYAKWWTETIKKKESP